VEGCPIVVARSTTDPTIPRVPLLACDRIGRLGPGAVAEALARGLAAGGWPETDRYELHEAHAGPDLAEALAKDDFDRRLHRARALVIAVDELLRDDLAATAAFDLATRSRQGGVPTYALAGRVEIDAFTARMLDLQLVVQARGPRGLEQAARRLAAVI
jgi:glycerate kinase